ncbi:MFS transporter [Streptomyces sp. 4N509B]|uniref:MFS transporter n=1 Tax=Streptomyces sp. 4N509B TaxID=3457413 RepID=UPI003FD097F8
MGRPAAGLRGYREIFRIPGVGGFVAASLVGRLPLSTVSLATVFLVTEATGSYAVAGTVAATGALCFALLVPQLGYLTDRVGQRRTLRPLAWAFGLAGAAFVLAAQSSAPTWLLVAAGAAFGATMPPVSAMIRARWSHLAGRDDGGLLRSAYSFESVADELTFVVGPLLVSVIVVLHPAVGVGAVALFGAVGSLMLAAQRRTEPPVLPRLATGRRAITVPGLRLMCVMYVATAAMFAGHELSTVSFVDEHGEPWMVGAVLGTYALGSAVGGLWYGARVWSMPLDRRFLLAIAAMVAGVAPLWAVPSVAVLWAISPVCGLLIAPGIIAGYSLVREGVPAESLTEGMTWVSTAVGVGKALGVLAAGLVIESAGPRWGYAFSLGCGCLALVVGLLGVRTLRTMAASGLTRAA